MDRRGLVPLTLAAVVAMAALLVGCGSNHDPVVAGITYTPADSTRPGGAISLKVTASDADNDALTCAWTATGGSFTRSTGDTTTWLSPAAVGQYSIQALVTDGAGGSATGQQVLRVRGWRIGNADTSTTDSIRLGNPGTAFVSLDLTPIVPDGALADSGRITALFEPDSMDGSSFVVYLVTPSGVEIPVWDHIGGDLEIDDVAISGIKDLSVKGVWKLKVVREVAGEEAYTDEFELDIYYRY